MAPPPYRRVQGGTVKRWLELRPLPMVALAYAVAPLLCVMAMMAYLRLDLTAPYAIVHAARTLANFSVIGFALEIVAVTPLLLGFRRWRWIWLNGWTAMAIGAAACFLFAFAFGLYIQVPFYPSTYASLLDVVIKAAREALPFGLLGAITAAVFRVLAVRTVHAMGSGEPPPMRLIDYVEAVIDRRRAGPSVGIALAILVLAIALAIPFLTPLERAGCLRQGGRWAHDACLGKEPG